MKILLPSQVGADPKALAQEIIIPYEQLASFLEKAENIQHSQGTIGTPDLLEAGIRNRKRPDTPPEELVSEDERTFERFGTTEATRTEERDAERRER